MCAIAGALALSPQLLISDALIRTVEGMAEMMRHRGPDISRIVEFDNHLLANNRLIIQDKSPLATMPITSDDGQVIMTFNGEISNFLELRNTFKLDEQHYFRTHSDTEVLLALYLKLGMHFLQHLNGMFALCIIDKRLNRALIIRDYFGITPLFYCQHQQHLYFSSEIKGLLQIPGLSRELNQESFFHLLTLGYMPRDFTPYRVIHELQQGELLEIDLASGNIELKKYYQIPRQKLFDISFDRASKDVEELLQQSVSRHLISDAPLGVTLSGGIDSSSFIGMMKKMKRSQGVHTFGIQVLENSFDEGHFQNVMSKFGETIHHQVKVTANDVLTALRSHMAFADEPYAHGAAIPTYLLGKCAKNFVRVLLCGEGGDELFNAYDTHAAYKVKALFNRLIPNSFANQLAIWSKYLPTGYSKLSLDFKMKRFLAGAHMDTPESHIFWRHLATDQLKARIMPSSKDFTPTAEQFRQYFEELADLPDLDKLSRLDLNFFFIGDLMVKNDRMMMAHSIESRFPYLDRDLVEYVSSLPPNIRFPLYRRRHLQKMALKNTLPPEILKRKSFGLELPYSKWFLDEWKELGDQHFNSSSSWRFPFFDWNVIEEIWNEHQRKEVDHGRLLWGILLAITWHQIFIETDDYKRLVLEINGDSLI